MGYNRMISLPDDLSEKLKKEDNASSLIQDLLYAHYEKTEVKPKKKDFLTIEELRAERERLSTETSDYQKVMDNLTEQEQKLVTKIQLENETKIKKQDEQKKVYSDFLLHLFELCPEDAIKYGAEYYNDVKDKAATTLYDFGLSKNLKEREVNL